MNVHQRQVFKVRGTLKNIKIQTNFINLRHEIFYKFYTLGKLVIYNFTYRHSLASRTFLKVKYYLVCMEFPMETNFHFSKWKIYFSIVCIGVSNPSFIKKATLLFYLALIKSENSPSSLFLGDIPLCIGFS